MLASKPLFQMERLKALVRGGKYNDWRFTAAFWANSILHLALFVLFLIFFGVPSLEKYLEKQTIVISSEEQSNGIEAPAITFALKRPSWISVDDKDLDLKSFVMFHRCQNLNFTDMDICHKNGTFERSDFMKLATMGYYKGRRRSLLDDNSLWTEDMTVTYHGRHFTLSPSMKMAKGPHQSLNFEVDNSFDYYIWLHDENFFVLNISPFGVPSKLWTIPGKRLRDEDGIRHLVTLTKHKRLNLDRRPCEEDPSYRFTACVKEKLSEKVGCKLPWANKRGNQGQAVCETEQEFVRFEKLYRELYFAESEKMVQMTGCVWPCAYKEYKFEVTGKSSTLPKTDPESSPDSQSLISFWLATNKIRIDEEVLLYPFTSLLAEFGGALGLFFGFSFLAIWQEISRLCLQL